MGAVVAVVKPLLISIATHPAVKNLVIELLTKYVKSTDNSIDDSTDVNINLPNVINLGAWTP